MTREELKAQATELKLDFKDNTPTEKLSQMVEEALFNKVEKSFGNEPTEAPKVVTAGKVEKKDPRKEAYLMVRCIITPLDSRMADLPGEIFSVGNGVIGFQKKVVQFNVETLEPAFILETIKEKKMLQQTKTVDSKGMPVVTKRLVPAYNIQYLPKFTPAELEVFLAKK